MTITDLGQRGKRVYMLKRVMLCVCLSGVVLASKDGEKELDVKWVKGPSKVNLSTVSTLQIPAGYGFTDAEGTRSVMQAMGNIVSHSEIGMLASSNGWFAVFDFDPIGYVSDEEKDTLDADALMKTFKEGEVKSNAYRREHGMEEIEVVGWFKKPFYNTKTHNLEWCTSLRTKGETNLFANHNIRILGRKGITRVVLVADFDKLEESIPALAGILDAYEYQAGQKYAEFRQGDKIAKYGLAALVAGGAATVAVKSGMLKPLIKFGVLIFAGIAAFFAKFFKRKE
jgi:uncharacterized membrane-anchored protein